MSDVFLLYLFMRLDAIRILAIVVFVLGLLFLVPSVLHADDEGWVPGKLKLVKRAAAVPIIAVIVSVGVPSKSEMAIIVGGKIALDAARTDTAREVGSEVLAAIRAQLKNSAK